MKYNVLFVFLFLAWGCTKEQQPAEISNYFIGETIQQMTDIMVHDITNPPLAARFYAYACLAGYEVVAQNDSVYPSMHGVLNDYPKIGKPQGLDNHQGQLTALLAMIETAKTMQPSGPEIQAFEDSLLDTCRQMGFSEETIDHSTQYAKAVSREILDYAHADRYNLISNFPRYTPAGTEGTWYPTPPGYFPPVEPYFHTIRPFTLDSGTQFKPVPPVPFSEDKNSEFFKMTEEVYQTNLSQENKEIAAFWDCNPFALQDNGHLMVGMKKISPGAHWMGIADIASKKANFDFQKTMKINTLLAIGLTDGFISCWDEKFRSNRIRPETAIRKYIDPTWIPFLQTPPFPEYISGHSTISTAAAVILTHYFGENFSYSDTVEERYGLEARNFDSFSHAAQEASISRLFGGIHFMDAIVNGQEQGANLGDWVIDKVKNTP